MRTVWYEWKKLCAFHWFWFIFAVFLFFNLWTLSEKMKMESFSAESVKRIYADFKAQPAEKRDDWLKHFGYQKTPVYTGNPYIEKELYKKVRREFMQAGQYDGYLEEIRERSARMSIAIFSDDGTFAYRNAQRTPPAYEKLKGLSFENDVSEGVTFAVHAEFTDLCVLMMLAVTVYFLILYEKKNKLYPLLKTCSRGRGAVIGAKLAVAAGVTLLLVAVFYGGNYFLAFRTYGFGALSRPIQSVTAFYESPYRLSVGQMLGLYLLLKAAVCCAVILLMIWLAQKTDTPAGAMLAIASVGIAEYLLRAVLPSVSYADVLKYVNFAEHMKVYPILSNYHNLDFFEYPVNALSVFLVILPAVVLLLLFFNVRTFTHCRKTKKERRRTKNGDERIGFVLDQLFLYEWMKNLLANRTLLVCAALLYGALLVGNSIPVSRGIDEEYYRFYMTEQQGLMTPEKLRYFAKERKKYEEIYALTPANSGLTPSEIERKQSESIYAYMGFRRAYSTAQYIMENNVKKGVNEQALVYEKGYELLFGDAAVRERLLDILFCVIAAVYSSSAILGVEYDRKVVGLLRSTKNGRRTLLKTKLAVACTVTAAMFVLVKIPMVWKIAKSYPLGSYGAKVRSMMFAGRSLFNCSILVYGLLLLIMQIVTLFCIVLCVTALSAVLKDTMLTMMISLALFGGPLLMEWGGLPAVHYMTFNSLLDAHRLLQESWFALIGEILIFWVEIPTAAGYVLYEIYEERR